MGSKPKNHEDLLLDWHLNRLDDEQRLWVAAELDRDETFRAKSERLQRVLEPLDDWRVAPGSAHLADSVLAAIENTKEVAPVMASAARMDDSLALPSHARFRRGRRVFAPTSRRVRARHIRVEASITTGHVLKQPALDFYGHRRLSTFLCGVATVRR